MVHLPKSFYDGDLHAGKEPYSIIKPQQQQLNPYAAKMKGSVFHLLSWDWDTVHFSILSWNSDVHHFGPSPVSAAVGVCEDTVLACLWVSLIMRNTRTFWAVEFSFTKGILEWEKKVLMKCSPNCWWCFFFF